MCNIYGRSSVSEIQPLFFFLPQNADETCTFRPQVDFLTDWLRSVRSWGYWDQWFWTKITITSSSKDMALILKPNLWFEKWHFCAKKKGKTIFVLFIYCIKQFLNTRWHKNSQKKLRNTTLAYCHLIMLLRLIAANNCLLTYSANSEKHEPPIGVDLYWLLRKRLLDAQLGKANVSLNRLCAVSGQVASTLHVSPCVEMASCSFISSCRVMRATALKYTVYVWTREPKQRV